MDKADNLIELGEKFRLARISKGMSQTDLAYKVGKDQPSINRLERGAINSSYNYLMEVCEGLEISLVEVLTKY